MNTRTILGCFVAMLVAIVAISTVMAGPLAVSINEVSVNDETLGSTTTFAGSVSDEVDVKTVFTVTSTDDLEDVKVKAWISGYKDDIEASTARFDALSGRTYAKELTLKLPNVNDVDDLDEDLTLHVEISDKNDDIEAEYTFTVQRDSYVYDMLSVEAPSQALAGEVVAIDVVLKNTGRNELEDTFVTAKISELGVYKKVYFGDIAPEDNYDDNDNAVDAKERRVYLVIPSDAKSGEYKLEVKASNYDADSLVVKSIEIKSRTEESAITAEADASEEGISNSMVILTVALVIVFVVLLVVLIVLLTKRPEEKLEDFGETSYY